MKIDIICERCGWRKEANKAWVRKEADQWSDPDVQVQIPDGWHFWLGKLICDTCIEDLNRFFEVAPPRAGM